MQIWFSYCQKNRSAILANSRFKNFRNVRKPIIGLISSTNEEKCLHICSVIVFICIKQDLKRMVRKAILKAAVCSFFGLKIIQNKLLSKFISSSVQNYRLA